MWFQDGVDKGHLIVRVRVWPRILELNEQQVVIVHLVRDINIYIHRSTDKGYIDHSDIAELISSHDRRTKFYPQDNNAL